MGNIVGGLIGGVGSLLGGKSAKSNDLTGYNYLRGDAANQAAQGSVAPAIGSQTAALGKEGGLADTASSLLTGGTAGNAAFNNYLNSTGYKFQMDQGTRAITGNAASRGLLGSGGTAKALTQYGQGLAGNYFNNYLGQLDAAGRAQGNTALGYGSQVTTGVGAGNAVGQAGTSGGQAAGNAMQSGTTNFFGKLAGVAGSLIGI